MIEMNDITITISWKNVLVAWTCIHLVCSIVKYYQTLLEAKRQLKEIKQQFPNATLRFSGIICCSIGCLTEPPWRIIYLAFTIVQWPLNHIIGRMIKLVMLGEWGSLWIVSKCPVTSTKEMAKLFLPGWEWERRQQPGGEYKYVREYKWWLPKNRATTLL